MSDGESAQPPVAPAPAEPITTASNDAKSNDQEATATNGASNGDVTTSNSEEVAKKEAATDGDSAPAEEKQSKADDAPQAKVDTEAVQGDVEMKDTDNITDAKEAADGSVEPAEGTPASANKFKGRRKSGGVPEHKGKKLSKKASIAKITHADAQPGDYFFARLKGYPPWPCIICSEDMLPPSLLKSRPQTAMQEDGTYKPAYADGGPKIKDRTFPIMYLATNEFGWHSNTDLSDIDLDTVGEATALKKKDLKEAHKIASEKHDLDYFRQMLINHEETRKAEILEKEEKAAAIEAKKAAKAKRKSKSAVEAVDVEDAEMVDVAAEGEADTAEPSAKKKTKKRKAEEDAEAPVAPDSNKKPKVSIKLTQKTNGNDTVTTPKPKKEKEAVTKTPKSKTKKTPKAKESVEVAPKEPELSPEEKMAKKEKEILFLRHKLQKGLLTKEQEPKEDEMKAMSEFVTKLEGYSDLEVSIIRKTKINKVLKAILKLPTIPKEDELQFKPRSQTLLDKWNKLLAGEQETPAATTTNGTTEEAKKTEELEPAAAESAVNGAKDSPANVSDENAATNGDEKAKTEESLEEAAEEKPKEEEKAKAISAEKLADVDVKDGPKIEQTVEDASKTAAEDTAVEPSA
ncbi:hypothetical protein BP6252_09101 [Coleophoma cylindrospora]|uniref:PWWP domain-containing protein n=1 Tax=Coleophoma cylindrospora TaxID=1849047 RepID=A0A3D8R107_9HELO|nr:hypothetical protein BP6252_09101 [Coleophoma cylindrospora]